MRKLKYHVASTVDGFIAHEDHSIDGFVSEGEHVIDYLESLKHDYDIVLMGRRTYEFGFQFGVTNPYPWMKQYVFSRTMERSPDPNVELVSKEITGFVEGLKKGAGKDIYLCGGADLAGKLFAEGGRRNHSKAESCRVWVRYSSVFGCCQAGRFGTNRQQGLWQRCRVA